MMIISTTTTPTTYTTNSICTMIMSANIIIMTMMIITSLIRLSTCGLAHFAHSHHSWLEVESRDVRQCGGL